MKKQRQSDTTPIPLLIASDFFGLLLSVLPVTATYAFLFFVGLRLWPTLEYFIPYLLFFPWLACLAFTILLFCIRLTFPKLRPGRYAVGLNSGFLAWSLNFYLSRAIALSGLRNFIYTNNILRFLYLRAMGGKFPYQMNGSMGIDFSDLPLIEVGRGSTLGEGVYMAAHSFTGQFLILAPVKIGENVFLGMDVTVGPGCDIGANSWIGGRNTFLNDKIPPGSQLPNFAWDRGNPERIEKMEIRLGDATAAATPPSSQKE